MRFLMHIAVVASLLATAFTATAQVKVVESVSVTGQPASAARQQSSSEPVQSTSGSAPSPNANAQLFYQLQLLQDEVLRLQGLLEEQQHELQQLKQQQRDDYMNLDRRIGESQKTSQAPSPQPVANLSSADEDYVKAYNAAYELIPQRKFVEARKAFESYVVKYAGTPYEANAYYWLGELHLLDANNAKAKEAFRTILTRFPGHGKYPEALYKTATINFDQGDKATAKQQLDTLIKQYGDIQAHADVIGKARSFKQKNHL